ncbi:MAG: hypothetical protein EKK62_03150 [Acidimicrobiia bacterium]|nr:MAG: hypothetical protein EKK62_03150 [Acidimicrobiia bacterium]
MKVKVEVDTKALAALSLGLSTVASGETARAITREIAGELDALVREQFQRGRDPYGVPWEAPKDGGRPGVRSGKLKGSVSVRAAGNRILLSASGVPYARFFSRGTSRMAARPIFPEASIGLPPKWRDIIDKAARRYVRRAVKGR